MKAIECTNKLNYLRDLQGMVQVLSATKRVQEMFLMFEPFYEILSIVDGAVLSEKGFPPARNISVLKITSIYNLIYTSKIIILAIYICITQKFAYCKSSNEIKAHS